MNNIVTVTNEVVIASASGGPTTIQLTRYPVVSEYILLNDVIQNQPTDYTINYTTGLITFTNELHMNDVISASYVASTIEIFLALSNQTAYVLKNINIIQYAVSVNATTLNIYPEYTVSGATITLSDEAFPTGLTASDSITASYQFIQTGEITVISATTGQTAFYLFYPNIQAGSVRIMKNDKVLLENTDYTLNYTSGLVTISAMTVGDFVTSDYIASTTGEIVILSATGGELLLTLQHDNPITSGLILTLNTSTVLKAVSDYTLDTTTGEIIFTNALTLADSVSVAYSYDFSEDITNLLSGELECDLDHAAITSLVLKKNTIIITDYLVDYISGHITLLHPLELVDTLTASYSYYTSQIDEYLSKKAFTQYTDLLGYHNVEILKNGSPISYTYDFSIGKITFLEQILTTDVITTSYLYLPSQSQVNVFFGPNSTFTLTDTPIRYGTVTVTKNSIPLVEYIDFNLNYNTGILKTIIPLVLGDTLQINFKYGGCLCIPATGIHPIEFYSVDLNGEKEETNNSEFRFDPLPPITIVDVPIGRQTEITTISFYASDSISGVDKTYYTTNGSIPTINSSTDSSFTLDKTGLYTINYFSIDLAGNVETYKTASVDIMIDSEAPDVSIQESFPIDGDNGYYKTAPQISIIASDELNLDKIYYKLVSSTNITTAKYTSLPITTIDLSVNYNIKLEIDQSGTEVQIDLRGFIPNTTTITDIIDNINTALRTIASVIDEDSITDGTFTLTTLNSGIRSVSRIHNITTNEYYTYVSNTTDTITFTGITPPTVSDVMAVSYEYQSLNIAYETDINGTTGTGYVTLISPTAGTGSSTSEIKFLEPTSANASTLVFGLGTAFPYVFTESNVFIEYTVPFTLPSNGRYNLQAYAQDLKNNIGTVVGRNYQLDSTNPVSTSVVLNGTLGNNGYYISNPTIRFSGTDNLSGINQIFYKWNADLLYREYRDTRPVDDSTSIPSDGIHTLHFYSTDRAGNIETVNNEVFKLDTINPMTIDNTAGVGTIDINHIVISKTGPISILNISNNIMDFSGPEPAGPFDLNNFTLQDITDVINSYSSLGYSATLVYSPTYTEATLQPATSLFDANNLSISPTPILIYGGIVIKLLASDSTSGIENTYYSYTTDGSIPAVPTTIGVLTIVETLSVRTAGSWVFNVIAIGGETLSKLKYQPIVNLILYKNPGSNILIEGIDYILNYNTGKITLTNPLLAGQSLYSIYSYGTLLPFSDDGIYRVRYYSKDNAGNIETTKISVPITIVRNLPVISYTPSVSPQVSGWFITNPNIQIQATATFPETITSLYYRWDSDPFILIVNPGVITIPSDGIHTLEAYALDSLYRVSEIKTEVFQKDEVDPVSTDNTIITVVGEVIIASATGFEVSEFLNNPYVILGTIVVKKNTVPLILNTDYVINYSTGEITFTSGVIAYLDQITADYQCLITTNNTFNLTINISDLTSGWNKTFYEIGTVVSPPVTPTLFSAYLTGSSVVVPLATTNEWIVKYRSQDIAGNLEGVKQTEIIRVDKTLPTTTLLTTPVLPDGDNNFYKTCVISFNVNANSAGVKETFYKLTNVWARYTSPFTIPDGIYNIEYYSIDLAGNTESVNTLLLKQDNLAPVTTDNIPNGFVSSSQIVLSINDTVSGVYKTYYKLLTSFFLPVNLKAVVGINVGSISGNTIKLPNAFLEIGEVIYVDNIPITNGIDYTIDSDYGIVTFLGVISGNVTADYFYFADFDGNNEGSIFNVTAEGNYIVQYFSIDNAGNYEVVKTALNLLKIDLTPPVVFDIYPPGLIITDTTESFGFKVQDFGVNPSGVDPFSIRVSVDGIEYSLLKDSQYFIVKAVGTSINDVLTETTILTNEILVPSALGGEQSFTLSNLGIALNTQRVYKNDILIQDVVDYNFNNSLGTLDLILPLAINETLKITYRYLVVFHNLYEVVIANTVLNTVNIPGGSTSYIMTNGIPASVYISDGIGLIDGVDYTVSGNTILFTNPTVNAVLTYKSPIGALKTIPNFDVINTIVIDPNDISGNILLPIIYSFIPVDSGVPEITQLNPIPNAQDVSIFTNVMFRIQDDESGVDIQSVNVKVNTVEYKLKTEATLEIQYLGMAAIATLTIANKYFITRINGAIDVSFSFLDIKYSTVQNVVDHLNSLPTYSCVLLDGKFSQESSEILVGVKNLDIIPPVVLNSQPINDTSFVYKEISNGFLITVSPATFENRQTVPVVINASDNNSNIMPTVTYSFQTQLGASESIDRRLQIMSERDHIMAEINSNLANNYNTKTTATEFYSYQSDFAKELARFKMLLVFALNDYYLGNVENRLLWQNFGLLIDFLPSNPVSLEIYRTFLLALSQGYFDGSLTSSIQNAIGLFTDGNIYVRERYQYSTDLSEQFVFDILVEVTSGSSILSLLSLLNTDLYKVIRKIKPAHTFFLLGFLFKEDVSIGAGCDSVVLKDIFGNILYDYYGHEMYEYDGNSYRLFKNGVELIEVRDFRINTLTGKIVLTTTLSAGDIITGDLKIKYFVDEIITGGLGGYTCQCSSFPIFPLSYKIYRNQILIKEKVDYTFELSTGVVTLNTVLGYNDIIRIKYSWFDQTINSYIYTGLGGDYIFYLPDVPVGNIQFLKRVRKTLTALCDRSFMKIEGVVPYIDFKLNGKPKFFTLNDGSSDMNDIAQIVDTHWLAWDSDRLDFVFSFEDFFPLPNDILNILINMFAGIENLIVMNEQLIYINIRCELVEYDRSFYLPDTRHPEALSSLSDSRLNGIQVLWKGLGKIKASLRRITIFSSYEDFLPVFSDNMSFVFQFDNIENITIFNDILMIDYNLVLTELIIQFIDSIEQTLVCSYEDFFPVISDSVTMILEVVNNENIVFGSDQVMINIDCELTETIQIALDSIELLLFKYEEFFPVVSDSVKIQLENINNESIVIGNDVIMINFNLELLEYENSFYLPDTTNPEALSSLSNSRLNGIQVLWRGYGSIRDYLRSMILV